MTKTKAADFLQNMVQEITESPLRTAQAASNPAVRMQTISTRAGLKHIGGYLDIETVEKVAILRARLKLDNSELLKLAIDELHMKHMAKRAFGDM